MGQIIVCKSSELETGKMKKFPVKIKDLKSYTVAIESEDVFIEI